MAAKKMSQNKKKKKRKEVSVSTWKHELIIDTKVIIFSTSKEAYSV